MDGLYMAKIPIKLWLKLNDREYEIFRRSSHMFNDFVAEVKAPPTGIVIEKLIKLDETLQNVINLIQNLIKSLDKIKNKEEITFWKSQITKLEEDVDNQVKIHVESFEKDPENDREYLARASQELLALKRAAALDWKGFANVKGYPIESEVSGVEGNDNENLDNVNETEDVTKMVEDENELDVKLDDESLVVEKVGDIPEASEKEIDDSLKEKVSHDIYALEEASNDVNELLDNPEATEADVVSSVNETTQPRYELNACFAKEMQIEHDSDETSEDSKDERIDIHEVVEVVAEKGEGQKSDPKSDRDIVEIDDDAVFDVNIENSELSDEETIVKVNEEDTNEDVQGYDENSGNENDDLLDYKVDEDTDDEVRGHIEIKVNENDDKMNNEVYEDVLDDEVKNFVVDVKKDSMDVLENPHEFIEVVFERNVVKLLFEGTFEENIKEILENLDKFPEPEIEVEEVTFHKHDANVSKLEYKVETNSVEAHLADILNGTVDESQDIPENDAKAKVRNDASVAVVMNVVPVGDRKAASDETVLKEPVPDDESENKIKAEEEVGKSASLKALKLKMIAKLVMPKVAPIPANAIAMDKNWFNKEHNCVLVKVLMIIIATKPTGTLVNYLKVMNDMIGLDNYKKPLSFPWRPGDILHWLCYSVVMTVFALQLLYVLFLLLKGSEYTVVNTAVFSKFYMKAEECDLSVPYIVNIDLEQETKEHEVELSEAKLCLCQMFLNKKVDNMQVDQTASADNFMVSVTLLSQAEVYSQGESIFTVLLRLKSYPQEQPTLPVKGGAANPYLALLRQSL